MPKPTGTCARCGEPNPPSGNNRPRKYCSKRCTREASRSKPKPACSIEQCTSPQVARGLCKTHWAKQYGKPTRYQIACATCGTEHMSARKDGRFCSDECKGVAYQTERRTRSRELVHVGPPDPVTWLPARHPAMRPAKQRKPYLFHAGTCAWCGDGFTDWQPAARYCSKRCTTRASGSRSRKRKGYPKLHLTQVERVAIYVRDEWTCQLCLEPVDPTLMLTNANDDWAPSLDHIVTRAAGGPDEPYNLRLAHRWCNSVRSDERHHSVDVLRISPAA